MADLKERDLGLGACPDSEPQASSLKPLPLLDHGYARLLESWGSDEAIVASARVSTQKGFQGWGDSEKPGDEKLLRYLWEHRHTTPFETAGATIEVRAPIFVFREWHRHRTQSYNEASARYAPLPALDYVPEVQRILGLHEPRPATRQAGALAGAELLTADNARRWQARTRELYAELEEHYQLGLRIGVPKELARITMPVGRYSTMRASANLLNWTRFLALRLPDSAQWEIRVFAGAVAEILSERFPRTMALFGESLLADFNERNQT